MATILLRNGPGVFFVPSSETGRQSRMNGAKMLFSRDGLSSDESTGTATLQPGRARSVGTQYLTQVSTHEKDSSQFIQSSDVR